jgi:translation elongation factor EF-Tu-like GTPase
MADGQGYRPHFRIIGCSELLGVQFVEGPDRYIHPKEKVQAKAELIYYPDVSYENLIIGKEFEILEGTNIVGKGIVIST